MRVIIAGTRHLSDGQRSVARAMEKAQAEGIFPSLVLSGDGGDADHHGALWAKARGIPVEHFPAQWRNTKLPHPDTGQPLVRQGRFGAYNAAAGPARNALMAQRASAQEGETPGALVAIWDGKSSGTKDMIDRARKAGLRVLIHPAGEGHD